MTTANPTVTEATVHRSFLSKVRHGLMDKDHFSELNRYLPWRYALGTLVMAGVAAAFCGIFLHVQAYVILMGIVAVLVLGLAWPWLSMIGIKATLSFETRQTIEGTAANAKLVVTNWMPIGAWGLRLAMVGVDPKAGTSDTTVSLAVSPGFRQTEFRFPFIPPGRGVYPTRQATIGTAFPFGLRESQRSVEVVNSLIVWPTSYPLGPIPEAASSDRSREGLVSMNKSGPSGDIFGIRPYVRGDSLRNVHWAQTARTGAMIICERQASACTHLQLVLDLDPKVHVDSGSESSREWAIRVGASVADCFLKQGSLVEAVIHGDVLGPEMGSRFRSRIFDTLARITPEMGDPLDQILALPACRKFRHGLQVVVTTDRGLSGVSVEHLRHHVAHWIVLRTAAFDPKFRGPSELPVRPWIEIDQADDIPLLLRRRWREVLCAN